MGHASCKSTPAFRSISSFFFLQSVYEEVVNVFIDGLIEFGVKGGDVLKVVSVVSFFISCIDYYIMDNKCVCRF